MAARLNIKSIYNKCEKYKLRTHACRQDLSFKGETRRDDDATSSSSLDTVPEIIQVEDEPGAVVGAPLAVLSILSVAIDPAHCELHLVAREVVCRCVQVTGLVEVDDAAYCVEVDASVEVLQGGRKRAVDALARLIIVQNEKVGQGKIL